ncbi:hypothetical protein B835_1293 [Enterococcus mundtii 3F]|nr:hypothetical protein [Enterococcus mundtii 3F]
MYQGQIWIDCLKFLGQFFCHFSNLGLWTTVGIDKGKEGHSYYPFCSRFYFLNKLLK